jgi:hypothetical protein
MNFDVILTNIPKDFIPIFDCATLEQQRLADADGDDGTPERRAHRGSPTENHVTKNLLVRQTETNQAAHGREHENKHDGIPDAFLDATPAALCVWTRHDSHQFTRVHAELTG